MWQEPHSALLHALAKGAGSSRMMAKKFENSGIREGIEVPNESYNVPDLVIGEKIAPGGHGGNVMSDSCTSGAASHTPF